MKSTRLATSTGPRKLLGILGNQVNGLVHFERKPWRRAKTLLGAPIEGFIEFSLNYVIEINGRCHDRFGIKPRRK